MVASRLVSFFRPEDFAAIRGHPRFRRTVDEAARADLHGQRALPRDLRWLSRDLAGHALVGAALILEVTPDGLSGRTLFEAAQRNRTCSRGRAAAFLNRLIALGHADVADGAGPWTRRRVTLSEGFKAAYGPRATGLLEAIAVFEPRLAGAAERALRPGRFSHFLLALALLQPTRPDLFAGPEMPIMLFLGRDGGKRVLDDLMGRLPAERTRMLTDVEVSVSALARDNHVSRTQVQRLLADGEAQGLLRIQGRRLSFSRVLSDDVERHYALVFELVRAAALTAGLDRD